VAVYVMDVDGSRLHLLAGDGPAFPATVAAPLGIGPEIPLPVLPRLVEVVEAAVPGGACAPLRLGDSAIGCLVGGPDADRERLTAAAPEVAVSLELAGAYTDEVHAARRRRETRPASEVQQNLLPPRIARVVGGDLAGGVLPGYAIGGDLFDWAQNEEGLWLAVIDAVGKGNEAAGLACIAVGALRSARRAGADIEEAVREMDAAVGSMGRRTDFVTAVVAVLRAPQGWLEWITAGHPRPVVADAGGRLRTLEDGVRPPLGFGAGSRRGSGRVRLDPGARLVLYSDGVVEQVDRATGRPVGVDGLHRAIGGSDGSPAAVVRRVQDVVVHAADGRLRDDATLLTVRVLGPGEASRPAEG
jgi:serine phosphatase RsbU (regulator of sigma subunit)